MTLSEGAQFGPYRILGALGAGGMGEVYRAHDGRLQREVALKVLPAPAKADETACQRLLQEARLASALNHPNICTIFEAGEVEGHQYVAMELVKGQTLRAAIPSEGLPPQTVTRYAVQIADGLAAAHEQGIVHCDLKCANVMITPEGRVKVLDFGLARRRWKDLADAVTQSRAALEEANRPGGTLPYMAPEVLQGSPPDARSDLWALGVMLYECVCGHVPFCGATGFALTSAILRDPPPPLPPDVPAALRAVILRCLGKDPAERYQTAAEVRAALEMSLSSPTVAQVIPPAPQRKWMLAALGVLVLAVGIAAWVGWDRMAHRTSRIESIAVLPLENFSRDPDQEFFADGMTEQLITDLSKIGTLTVKSRTSVMQYKGNHRKPLPEIAKELGVDAVVEGSVQRSGDRVRITAQLIQAATDKHLWAETYDRDLRDVLTLQAEVTRSIADQIRITLTPEEKARLGSRRQVDPEVFQLYLKGQYDLSPSGTDGRKSVTDFQQAIAKDPSYAPAHAGLAMAYGGLASVVAAPKDVMPKAKAEALRALELDETLPEAHVALAQVLMFYEWNWDGAEKEIRRAIELNPSSADAHHLYGIYLDTLSKSEPALREMERAHTLDPLSLMITGDWLSTLIHARQYDRVIEEARKLVAVNPDYAFAHAWMGLAYAQKKDFPPAIAELRKAQDLQPGYTMDHFLAVVLAAAGNKEEARKLVAKIESLSQHQYVCAYEVAEVHVALGDNEAAQKWLQRGVKEQCDCLVFLRAEPWMDPYRLDPRYEALVKRVFGSR